MNNKNIWLVFHGLGRSFSFDFIGNFLLSEAVGLINILFFDLRRLLKIYPSLSKILLCLLIFLFSQVVSDFVNGSIFTDFLRGWAMICFSMVSVLAMTGNFNNNKNGLIIYISVLFISNIFFRDQFFDLELYKEDTNYFKASIVQFSNPFIYILSFFLIRTLGVKAVALLFFVYAIVNLILDARSNFLIFFTTTYLLLFRNSKLRVTPFKVILFFSVFYIFYAVWVFLVLDNGFGGKNSSIQLGMATNPYNPFELLYYGRTDFFVLLTAIVDKPLFGHGSWGKDPYGIYSVYRLLGTDEPSYSDISYISAHSVFLGSWVWSGVIGFIAVTYMFLFLFKLMFKFYNSNLQSNYFPIMLAVTVDMLWAFFFSPLGLLRTTFPLFAAMLIVETKAISLIQTIGAKSETLR